MARAHKPNKKASDTDLVRLNALGLSLASIGKELDCHPSTITSRLAALGIAPADTRRTFMEDVLRTMPIPQIEWLYSKLGPNMNIKQFVKNLLMEAYLRDNP